MKNVTELLLSKFEGGGSTAIVWTPTNIRDADSGEMLARPKDLISWSPSNGGEKITGRIRSFDSRGTVTIDGNDGKVYRLVDL